MNTDPTDPGAVFDVVVLESGGRRQTLNASEFFGLPLSERIRHVIERTATFLKDGCEIDRQTALARLRAIRASKAAA